MTSEHPQDQQDQTLTPATLPPEDRAARRLPRSATLLLGGLLLIGALGTWYVVTQTGQDPAVASTAGAVATDVSTAPAGGTVTPAIPALNDSPKSGSATGAAASAGIKPVIPGSGQLTPPAAVTPPVANAELSPSAVLAAAPVGINPPDTLGLTPTRNPFKPLKISGVAGTATPGGGAIPTAAQVPTDAAAKFPSGSTPTVSLGSGSYGPGGAIPMPSLPLGGAPNGAASVGVTPLPTLSLGGLPGAPGSMTGAVVSLPGIGPVPTRTIPARPPLPIPTLTLSLPVLAFAPLDLPGVTLQEDALSLPVLLTSDVTDTTASSQVAVTRNPLAEFIARRALVFSAVVLGPVNTAIFTTATGYLVVPVGGTLPDSDIKLEQVSPTAVTLRLDTVTRSLDLTKGAP